MNEPLANNPSNRWQRRALSIPGLYLATLVGLLLSPLLLALTVVADVVTGPRRMRFSRVLAMGLSYLILECLATVGALFGWVVTGFGLAMNKRWAQLMHHRMQTWWTRALLAAMEHWLGARVDIDGAHLVGPGPALLLARHASFFDAVLPSVAMARTSPNTLVRHTLKRELAWSPALDLFGHRLPNHFVTRVPLDRTSERAAFTELARDLGQDTMVIFPEGTFHSPSRAARIHERLAESDPDRARRLDDLAHLLPARPGGILAALDGMSEGDLVFITHHGFEPFGSLREILANVPFRHPVHVEITRVAGDVIPTDDEGRLQLIDKMWLDMDHWIRSSQWGKQ